MGARSSPYALRSWLIVIAVAVAYLIIRETMGIAYPLWLQWIGIVVAGLIGAAVLIRPDLAATKSLTLARLIGAAFIMAAAVGAYLQFTKISVE